MRHFLPPVRGYLEVSPRPNNPRGLAVHAVVIEVEIQDREAAQQELTQRIVPMVSQSPGFVTGYWMAFGEDHGTSFVVFETEQQAQAAADMASENTSAPVTMTSIKTASVVAHA